MNNMNKQWKTAKKNKNINIIKQHINKETKNILLFTNKNKKTQKNKTRTNTTKSNKTTIIKDS